MELSIMDKAIIERKVNTLLLENGYSFETDTHVDIVRFVRNFGFVVGNADLGDDEDGFLAIQPLDPKTNNGENQRKVIGVNENRPFPFKRFVVAHEFAHWALHHETGKALLLRENKKGKNDKENDADYFAAALLMPRDSFERVYLRLKEQQLNYDVICSQLAATFNVPTESVLRRIDELQLLI